MRNGLRVLSFDIQIRLLHFCCLKVSGFIVRLCYLKYPTSARSSVVSSINTELFHRDCWSGQYWCTAGLARQYPAYNGEVQVIYEPISGNQRESERWTQRNRIQWNVHRELGLSKAGAVVVFASFFFFFFVFSNSSTVTRRPIVRIWSCKQKVAFLINSSNLKYYSLRNNFMF